MIENPHKRRYREAGERRADSHGLQVDSHREWAEAAAQKIENGDELTGMDRKLLSGIVRLWSAQLRDTPKKPAGRPRHVDYLLVTVYYWRMINVDGLSEPEAREQILMEFELDGPGHLDSILKAESVDADLIKSGQKNPE